jgi:hypothetical protein
MEPDQKDERSAALAGNIPKELHLFGIRGIQFTNYLVSTGNQF